MMTSDGQRSEGDSDHEEEMDEVAEERAQKEVEKCSFSANPYVLEQCSSHLFFCFNEFLLTFIAMMVTMVSIPLL